MKVGTEMFLNSNNFVGLNENVDNLDDLVLELETETNIHLKKLIESFNVLSESNAFFLELSLSNKSLTEDGNEETIKEKLARHKSNIVNISKTTATWFMKVISFIRSYVDSSTKWIKSNQNKLVYNSAKLKDKEFKIRYANLNKISEILNETSSTSSEISRNLNNESKNSLKLKKEDMPKSISINDLTGLNNVKELKNSLSVVKKQTFELSEIINSCFDIDREFKHAASQKKNIDKLNRDIQSVINSFKDDEMSPEDYSNVASNTIYFSSSISVLMLVIKSVVSALSKTLRNNMNILRRLV